MMRKRILVVDDEPRMRRFVRMNLDLEGYEVIEADNGLAALEQGARRACLTWCCWT